MATVRFPDGTTVGATSLTERREQPQKVDFGLYLDTRHGDPPHRPEWPHELVSWPDLGVPTSGPDAAEAIIRAFDRARSGQRVEVGCGAGLGRTGTVLACMAVLAGVPEGDAVRWLRTAYHPYAVETDDQRDWVRWFASWVPGRP